MDIKKEDKSMFYVVDQWDQYIREFDNRADADQYCEKWNASLRFSEWQAPKAHVIVGE